MHMLYVLKKLPFADMKNLLREVDIEDMALLSKLKNAKEITLSQK